MTVVVGSLFSGYAGLDLALDEVLGPTRVAWFSDIDPGPKRILKHRYPDVPNLGDITEIDWRAVEPVDVLTGGFPCQDVSHAGKRAGLKPDTRSGLWSQMAYAISILRPQLVIAENVRGLLSAPAHSDVEPCPWCLGDTDGEPAMRALGAVLADLADIGYDAQWIGLRAADVGAPHGRFRVFVVASPTDADDRGSRAGRAGSLWGTIAVNGIPDGTAADPEGDGRDERRTEPTRLVGGPHAAVSGAPAPDPDSEGRGRGQRARERHADRRDSADADGHPNEPAIRWGAYGPAVERWATVLGRPAPDPTEPGKTGDRLSPRFVEWMMGLPDGWVTDVPGLSRNEQLRALGNGVVPQQAAAAIRTLLRVAAS